MGSVPEDISELLELLQSEADRHGADPGDRFLLENGQMARLSLERKDGVDEYPRAVVSLSVPRLEQAIAAAVVALQAEPVKKEELGRTHLALGAREWTEENIRAMAGGQEKLETPPEPQNAKMKDIFRGSSYDYAVDLLRSYRPNFGEMPPQDRAALVNRVLEKVNPFLEALRGLVATIQHADPYEGLPNSPIKKAGEQIRAAELRDIEGLSNVELGRRFGIPQTGSDEIKNDNSRARERLVKPGRAKLKAAMGEDGYRAYVEESKAERQRWRSLSADARHIEDFAELVGTDAGKMRRIMESPQDEALQETKDFDEKQRFTAALARAAWQTLPRNSF